MGGYPDILAPELLETIHKKRVRTPGEKHRYAWNDGRMYYGLGWRVFEFRGHEMIFHAGSLDGYSSQIAWIPEYETGIVVLQNSRMVSAMLTNFFDVLLEKVDIDRPNL
jgi:beta-lactamase class C